jgi:hypothetical protein
MADLKTGIAALVAEHGLKAVEAELRSHKKPKKRGRPRRTEQKDMADWILVEARRRSQQETRKKTYRVCKDIITQAMANGTDDGTTAGALRSAFLRADRRIQSNPELKRRAEAAVDDIVQIFRSHDLSTQKLRLGDLRKKTR